MTVICIFHKSIATHYCLRTVHTAPGWRRC
uniref:Uncharacterized protein n=1 Tax=Anguilla anguilla TaxID=7936 RepID=A0A0E9S8S6_ANGAN